MITQESQKRNKNNKPRILIGAPQSDVKNYCFDEWLDNIKKLAYPEELIKIYLADNSSSPNNFRNFTRKKHIKGSYIYGGGGRTILERMTDSHNAVRKYCLDNDFDYLLHLETDIFPENMFIIDMLLAHRKKVVGVPYFIGQGIERRLCVMNMDETSRQFKLSYMCPDLDMQYYDGSIQKCHAAGVGCALIHRSVLEKIEFRYDKNLVAHPDTYFYIDCMLNNIPVFVDTGLYVKHKNETQWGEFGRDWK